MEKNEFDINTYLDGLVYAKSFNEGIFELAIDCDNFKQVEFLEELVNNDSNDSLARSYLTNDFVLEIIKHIENKTGKVVFLKNPIEEDKAFICHETLPSNKKCKEEVLYENNCMINNAIDAALENIMNNKEDTCSFSIQLYTSDHFYPLCIKKKGKEIIFIKSEPEVCESYSRWQNEIIENFKNRLNNYYKKYFDTIYICKEEEQNRKYDLVMEGRQVKNLCGIESVRKACKMQQHSFEYYKERSLKRFNINVEKEKVNDHQIINKENNYYKKNISFNEFDIGKRIIPTTNILLNNKILKKNNDVIEDNRFNNKKKMPFRRIKEFKNNKHIGVRKDNKINNSLMRRREYGQNILQKRRNKQMADNKYNANQHLMN